MHRIFTKFICFLVALSAWTCDRGPSPALSPVEEWQTFELDDDLVIELVASEPMVQDPVAISFDAEGRLWVTEMRGFMPNIDGTGKEERIGRISVLEDLDNDGRMDRSTVFLDSLILPRALAVVKGGALLAEKMPLWWAKDFDGDLKADTLLLVDSLYGDRGFVEHSPNGLWRGMDNWYYNAKSKYRYRLEKDTWIKEETEFRGQWGLSHDNEGRLYYNYNWSQLHADLVPPNYLSRNRHHRPTSGIDHGLTIDRRVFPIRPNPAVNRGYIPGTFDEEGRLREFTSACSPFVYRGNALPVEYQGNVFVCGPSANLVKRNLVTENGVMLNAKAAYEDREFLASSDERFRPVAIASGPDGALYIADIYRGIVQDDIYITPYLRQQSLDRKLDTPIHLGRIWRVRPANWTRPGQKDYSQLSNEGLVNALRNDNGWQRDMAQRLLVESGDTAIVPLLENLIIEPGVPAVSRVQSLWALEGMDQIVPKHLFAAWQSPDESVRVVAIRMLEKLAMFDEKLQTQLDSILEKAAVDASPKIALQIALSSSNLKTLSSVLGQYPQEPVIRDAVMSSLEDRELDFLIALLDEPLWRKSQPEKEIFLEMAATAIANSKNERKIKVLRSLCKNLPTEQAWQRHALMSGLTIRQVPQAAASDSTELLPMNEEDRQRFIAGRQLFLTTCSSCHGSRGEGLERFGPPLVKSEWVLENEKKLALILLHGMEGPVKVNGKVYDIPDIMPVMPSLSIIGDGDLAAVMTYIRQAWGNDAPPVQPGTVSRVRHRMQGKIQPWTAEELSALDPNDIATK